MTEQATGGQGEKKAGKPWWRKLLKAVVRAAVVMLVLGIAVYAGVNYWASRMIARELARARASGLPLSFVELNAQQPKSPAEQDAGPYYRAGMELAGVVELPDAEYDALYRRTEMPSEQALATGAALLKKQALALEMLDRGSALPGCNADIQVEYGMAAALPQLGKARRLADAGTLRTRMLAFEKKGGEAVSSLASTLGLLRIYDRQPVLVGSLVQWAVAKRICNDAGLVLSVGNAGEADLAKLDETIAGLKRIDPRRMFIAERVYSMEILRSTLGIESRTYDPKAPPTPPLPERMELANMGATGRIFAANSLEFGARVIEACSGDWPSTLDNMRVIASERGGVLNVGPILAPSFMRSLYNGAQTQCSLDATRIAIAIERYRLSHQGALPESLAALAKPGELPVDPMTGKEMLYVKVANGYCVMSAGRVDPTASRTIDRDKQPEEWAKLWGIQIRTGGK